MSVKEPKEEAPKKVQCQVITVSDIGVEETDKNGKKNYPNVRKKWPYNM